MDKTYQGIAILVLLFVLLFDGRRPATASVFYRLSRHVSARRREAIGAHEGRGVLRAGTTPGKILGHEYASGQEEMSRQCLLIL